MKLQLLLICPECGQTLTREEMAYGHDCCEMSEKSIEFWAEELAETAGKNICPRG